MSSFYFALKSVRLKDPIHIPVHCLASCVNRQTCACLSHCSSQRCSQNNTGPLFMLSNTGRVCDWCALGEALYKCLASMQYVHS